MNFYVIADSDESSDSVTMLKAEPLKTSEVDLSGTEIVTKVTESTNDYNDGYIHSAYLYSYTCTSSSLLSGIATGCTTDYKLSSIKQIVDSWVANKFETINLKFYEVGYSARLITYDEYVSLCESVEHQTPTNPYTSLDPVFDWMYNSNYSYWTMSPQEDDSSNVFYVSTIGDLRNDGFSSIGGNVGIRIYTVLLVVTLLKSAIK